MYIDSNLADGISNDEIGVRQIGRGCYIIIK